MAIPQEIIDLTYLALQDNKLTYIERGVIIKKGLAMGVDEQELNSFINASISDNMSRYPEGELTHCPSCGKHIPVIATQCLYCGTQLHNENEFIFAVGDEAKTIRRENEATDEEVMNITNCPDCGAPFPLLSNICPHCGHVLVAQRGSNLNVKYMTDLIAGSNYVLQNAPKPTFSDVITYHKVMFLYPMSLILFMTAFSYPDTLGGMILVLAIYLGWKSYKMLIEDTAASPITEANKEYYTALSDHKKYVRMVDAFYGNSKEVREYLAKFGNTVKEAAKIHRRNQFRLFFLIAAAITIAWVLPYLVSLIVNKGIIDDSFTIF